MYLFWDYMPNSLTQVVFVIKRDELGRLVTTEITQNTFDGWYVRPGLAPAPIELGSAIGRLPRGSPNLGQGLILRRPIIESETDPSLLEIDLAGGFIVRSQEPPAVHEARAEFHFPSTDITPWICEPERDVEYRRMLEAEGIADVPPSQLKIGVWYPVEVTNQTNDKGCGMFQLREALRAGRFNGVLRFVAETEWPLQAGVLHLARFRRPVGEALIIPRSPSPGRPLT